MKVLALDIGGTYIKAGVVTEGKLSDLKEFETQAHLGADALMQNILNIISCYLPFQRIGISTAGYVDTTRGNIIYANQAIPGYTGKPVKKIIEYAFKVPVAVENDVKAMAVGEAYYGAGRGEKDFLCLTYGTGVGGAIISEGRLYNGSGFCAGGFGGMITHGDKQNGSYESHASTTALVKEAMKYNKALSNGRKIFEQIDNPKVAAVVDSWIKEIVLGLVSLAYIFNPNLIIMGGGIINETYIVERVRVLLKKNTPEIFHGVAIKKAELGNTAGLIGAAHLAGLL